MIHFRRNVRFYSLFVLLLILGCWLRWRDIDTRPMHGDEANQAYQFQLLLEQGRYKYEPQDFHGPTLYYMTLPFSYAFFPQDFKDTRKYHFRGVTVFFSLITACGVLLFLDLLGRRGVLFLTLFQMVSPSLVFYSTYYIQETLLVCFTVFFLGSFWRFSRRPSLLWAIGSGISLGLMHATKETFILSLAALFLSLLTLFFLSGRRLRLKFTGKQVSAFFLAALITSVLFYSSFFSNPSGPLDSLKSFSYQIQRGLGGSDFPEHMTSGKAHAKPWNYYLQNIVGYYPKKLSSTAVDIWKNSPARPLTEVFFLLLPLFSFFSLKRKGRLNRFILCSFVYSVALFLIYSFIPYKTPWCMLSFHFGFLFCGALVLQRFLGRRKCHRLMLVPAGFIALFILDLGRQSSLINKETFTVSDKNQYAYVQPGYDVEGLALRIDKIASLDGRGFNMPIHFLTPEYWPLPWYLKKFDKVGYWENRVPKTDISGLPVIISTPDRVDVAKSLEKTHFVESRGRLPGYYLTVYYRMDLWHKLMDARHK